MVQVRQHQILTEDFHVSEFILIAELPQSIKVGVNQLKNRLAKKIGNYPGAMANPHIRVCSIAANSCLNSKVVDEITSSVRDFEGAESLQIDRINFSASTYSVGLQLQSNSRFNRIQKEIKARLKHRVGIKKHFSCSKSLTISIGSELKQSQFIKASYSFKSLKIDSSFEVKRLHLLKKKLGGNYELVESFVI